MVEPKERNKTETAYNPKNHAESKQETNDTSSERIMFTLTFIKRCVIQMKSAKQCWDAVRKGKHFFREVELRLRRMISLTGCRQATRQKRKACEVRESSRLRQAKGPVQVIFCDSNKI
ncbi:hypothetical protein llap_14019 [Limosa lapponica baueri]|uniref:Uncharacterized protein n=1 Tax=Limosa lapponica baueri TaxID=1758121 RepID=A0A2I0TPE1_LIMLA|nr:hypothetical protein llap_14019 [Limosa lapponica baueri]